MAVSKVYIQKAQKTGSSIHTTIPPEVVKHLTIQEGDTVLYKINSIGQVIIEKQKTVSEEMGVEKEFLSILQEGMAEYKDALDDLVDR